MAKVRRRAAGRAALIDEWRGSGSSLPASCRSHGLGRGAMQDRAYKPSLKRAVEEARRQAEAIPADPGQEDGHSPLEPPPASLPVHVTGVLSPSPPTHRAGVEVVLGSGRRVVLEAGFDSEALRRVVA